MGVDSAGCSISAEMGLEDNVRVAANDHRIKHRVAFRFK